jgi:hypothetical protein
MEGRRAAQGSLAWCSPVHPRLVNTLVKRFTLSNGRLSRRFVHRQKGQQRRDHGPTVAPVLSRSASPSMARVAPPSYTSGMAQQQPNEVVRLIAHAVVGAVVAGAVLWLVKGDPRIPAALVSGAVAIYAHEKLDAPVAQAIANL